MPRAVFWGQLRGKYQCSGLAGRRSVRTCVVAFPPPASVGTRGSRAKKQPSVQYSKLIDAIVREGGSAGLVRGGCGWTQDTVTCRRAGPSRIAGRHMMGGGRPAGRYASRSPDRPRLGYFGWRGDPRFLPLVRRPSLDRGVTRRRACAAPYRPGNAGPAAFWLSREGPCPLRWPRRNGPSQRRR